MAGGVMMLGTALAQTASTPSSTPAKHHPAAAHHTATATHKPTTTAKKASPITLTTQKEKFSYAVGMSIGNSLKQQNADVDTAVVAEGLKDMIAGNTKLTVEQAQAVLKEVQMDLHAKHEQAMAAVAETNKKAGDAFLKANASQKDVIVLPSGLQYKIIKEGTGPKPTASDTVECNYRGTLIDGKEFDSSAKHGGPATFPVSGVIKGWTEALQLMPVGSKWQLFVPSDLAYGERGAGADIGPNATLVFDVELLGIKDKK
jgi:FKBP-type peptidyl-prolyl cis-trans isomerase FklB